MRFPWNRRKAAGTASPAGPGSGNGEESLLALLSSVAPASHEANGSAVEAAALASLPEVSPDASLAVSTRVPGGPGPGLEDTRAESGAPQTANISVDGGASPFPVRVVHAALLIDTDAVHALVLGRLLRASGYQVETACSPEGAVEAFRRSFFGLVMIDCDCPEMDGLRIAAALRTIEAERNHTPLIALVSATSASHKARRKAAGFDNYLEKPVRLDKLKVVLSRFAPTSITGAEAQFANIDRSELAMLCGLRADGEAFLRHFVRLFLSSAQEHLDAMRTASEDSQPGVLAHHARRMRMLACQIGATPMQRVCDTVSEAAFTAPPVEMSAMLAELSRTLERVGADLRDAEVSILGRSAQESAARAERKANRGLLQPQRSTRVLIAEGNAFQSKFLATALSVAGHDVYQAFTGREALQLFREVTVDVAILDANTPEGDGYFLLSELRLDPKLKQLPVMILSDRYREQEVLRAFDLGADDYLPKPFNPLEVSARVRALLRRA